MPIDPMLLNSMLGTFKNMVEDCKSQNISGEDFDNMCEALARMEQLGEEHSDFNAFNGQVMQENLFGKFSDYYGKALSSKAQSNSGGDGAYDDKALLQQSVNALKQSIESIRKNYQDAIEIAKGNDVAEQRKIGLDFLERNIAGGKFDNTGGMDQLRKESDKELEETLKSKPNAFDSSVEVEVLNDPETIIKPIQDVIDLGETEGMTLPKFLRIQIEKGLDKAMEGSVASRSAYEFALAYEKINPITPYHLEKCEKNLKIFDELSSKQKFNVPNWTELKFAIDDISRELQPSINKWEAISKLWDKIIWDLSFWSLSYCSFAPYIKPWALSSNPQEAVIETQNTSPGIFKEREKLLQKYFGMGFMDIFKHPTFKWAVEYHYISYSQEFVEFLIEEIYPQCKPFNHLPSDLIEKRAGFYKKDRNSDDFEGNPEAHLPAIRNRDFYDSKFGAGRHLSKFGPIEENDSKAKPWSYETFKFK